MAYCIFLWEGGSYIINIIFNILLNENVYTSITYLTYSVYNTKSYIIYYNHYYV